MVRVLNPPDIVETRGPVVFLAGPIQGGSDWQSDAIRIMGESGKRFDIANPRKDYAPGTFVYEHQVDWETTYLKRAGAEGVVLFWLARQAYDTPGRPYAQTSRFELGEWMVRATHEGAKVVIGIEEGFSNERYIRRRFGQEHRSIQVQSRLEDVCMEALRIV